ncbi:acetyl-CoA synthetase-like protein [Tothia fuscella]|uniref:Acetyl-CoA synthetase-like protein n=1 Tax=Tothia fuscella TaxID=1048955 RepID=A0A9P4NU55_9PEZI|nr:acetyl-CoA synthetase-like protein [Tothia fuscella]
MGRPPRRLCYFTCVLSEALLYNQALQTSKVLDTTQGTICDHAEFSNINEFVDFLANKHGHHLAVGCITPGKKRSGDEAADSEELLTFRDVQTESCRLSHHFRSSLGKIGQERCCVGLLTSSSIVFMLTWLGLMRAGFEVLLIAPQSSPTAIRHLIHASHAFAIYCDHGHDDFVRKVFPQDGERQTDVHSAQQAENSTPSIQIFNIPWHSLEAIRSSDLNSPEDVEKPRKRPRRDSTAFYFHSSGTTGLPKLIPQTHIGAVNILPRLQKDDTTGPLTSTFTTTPLYHGGIADLFRSWSAASPLWIFPEGKLPIIGPTVSSIIDRIDDISSNRPGLPITRLGYVSCVPYVLQALCEMSELKERLLKLDAVGVGGAAMPQDLGDKLVADGVRLVSRFGSSECGFLLSSQRDYDNDKLWNVHRCLNQHGLQFAPLPHDRYELIVDGNWPLVSTAVHAQRPLNTHDVFIKDTEVPNGWRYIGRSDSQLTLSTGKKLDPVPIEEALRKSELIEDVVIVGDDRPFVAAVIFVSSKAQQLQGQELQKEIWNGIMRVNESMPSHAKLGQRSICTLDSKELSRVRRNVKGGVIRDIFVSDFEKELQGIYGSSADDVGSTTDMNSLDDITTFVSSIVHESFGLDRNIEVDDDLFDRGIDSILSLQIRNRICKAVPLKFRSTIPLNLVYECSTIRAVVQYISELLENDKQGVSPEDAGHAKLKEMKDMVDNYVHFQSETLGQVLEKNSEQGAERATNSLSVVLTGSTGFLGVHILKRLLQDDRVTAIFLFVRGSRLVLFEEQQERARTRVHAALTYHSILSTLPDSWEAKVEYIPFLLQDPYLGLQPNLYNDLVSKTTHVIHAAWEVNFNLPLKKFASQIEGTINLYNLALLASKKQRRQPTSFLFCSSVASVANREHNSEDGPTPPTSSTDPRHAANLGYGQSKWVTENVLDKLSRLHSANVSVSVLRIGQLSGDTQNGIWNMREAWPLMLEASFNVVNSDQEKGDERHTKGLVLPDLASTSLSPLDWLPVDHAAEQVWQTMNTESTPANSGLQVLNILNSGTDSVTWHQAQEWILAWASTHDIRITVLAPSEWLDKLEKVPTDHRAKSLVSLWRENWVTKSSETKTTANGRNKTGVENKDIGEKYVINRDYLWRILDWVARQ